MNTWFRRILHFWAQKTPQALSHCRKAAAAKHIEVAQSGEGGEDSAASKDDATASYKLNTELKLAKIAFLKFILMFMVFLLKMQGRAILLKDRKFDTARHVIILRDAGKPP
eukprot:5492475-Amphidinium_carterae.1